MNEGLIDGLDRGQRPAPPFPAPFPMFSCIGDSITSQAGVKTNTGNMNGGGWPQYASALTGGRILVGGIYGAPSLTSAEIRSMVLPTMLSDIRSQPTVKPGYCVVLAGTNDGSNFDLTRQSLVGIWTTLQKEGVIPILCTLTPRTTGATHQRINSFVRWYGAANGLRVLDFANDPTLTDNSTGAWLSGLSGDGLHPNGIGARAMGGVIATAFQAWGMCTWSPPLTQANTDPNNLFGTNGLFMTDTNADGVPDGHTLSGTGATCTLATATLPALGKTATITRGSDSTIWTMPSVTYTAGALVAFAVRLEVTTAGTTPDVQVALQYGGATYAWSGIGADLPAGSVFTGLMREGPAASIASRITISLGAGTVVKVSQLTAVSLTALGIA